MARIGGPPATSESVIILSAASGDASQSRRSRLPRRRASRMRDMLTWGPVFVTMASLEQKGGDVAAVLACHLPRFPKIPKVCSTQLFASTAAPGEPLRLLERQHVERSTWTRLFLRPSPRITNCNAAGGSSEIRPILSPSVLVFWGHFRYLRGQIWAI